jgi:hypothetical protein
MVRIRHIVWVLAAFNLVACLAFAMTEKAGATTGSVPCCIDAKADNTLPPPGNCFAPSVFGMCEDSSAPGTTPCAGTFTGTAIPAMLSSTTKSDSAEGCVLVDGNINVMLQIRKCSGKGASNCKCVPIMVGGQGVATKVASGLVCP